MPRQIRTRPVTPQQARAYLGKAEEYLEAAGAELEAGRAIAAASLPLKTKAEYDPDDIPGATARRAVEWATRCVAVARRVAAGQAPP